MAPFAIDLVEHGIGRQAEGGEGRRRPRPELGLGRMATGAGARRGNAACVTLMAAQGCVPPLQRNRMIEPAELHHGPGRFIPGRKQEFVTASAIVADDATAVLAVTTLVAT